ncbi:hypothetical protein [Vibrio comitans]
MLVNRYLYSDIEMCACLRLWPFNVGGTRQIEERCHKDIQKHRGKTDTNRHWLKVYRMPIWGLSLDSDKRRNEIERAVNGYFTTGSDSHIGVDLLQGETGT